MMNKILTITLIGIVLAWLFKDASATVKIAHAMTDVYTRGVGALTPK